MTPGEESSESELTKNNTSSQNTEADADHEKQMIGLVAVLCACFSSGFAGVFFEMLVKTGAQPSVVIRNLQLGMFSLIFATSTVIMYDWEAIKMHGFFQGYHPLVFVIVALQVRFSQLSNRIKMQRT